MPKHFIPAVVFSSQVIREITHMFIRHPSEAGSNEPPDQNQLMDRTFLRANITSVHTGSKQIYYLSNRSV